MTSQASWHTPVIPALGRQKQEDLEFKAVLDRLASLGYTGPRLKIKTKQNDKETSLCLAKTLERDTQQSTTPPLSLGYAFYNGLNKVITMYSFKKKKAQ